MNGPSVDAPAPPTLSFSQHLRHAFTPLTNRMNHGTTILDEVISMFRERIRAESEYARALERLCQRDFLRDEVGSVRMALQALKADMSNEYTARSEFVTSLDEEVYQPLVRFRQKFADANKDFITQTKTAVKQLRGERAKWMKVKTRFDRVERDAQVARQALMDAQNASSSQVVKVSSMLLGTRVNSTTKMHQQWTNKFESQKKVWNSEQHSFFEKMTSILEQMELYEAERLNCLCDCSRKCAVFITNLSANRSYDIRGIANIMDQTQPNQDVQELIQKLLKENPPKTPSNSDDEESRGGLSREGSTSRLAAFFSRSDAEDSLSLPRYSLSTSEAVSNAFSIATPPDLLNHELPIMNLPADRDSERFPVRSSSHNSEDDPDLPPFNHDMSLDAESARVTPPDLGVNHNHHDQLPEGDGGEESLSNTGSSYLHISTNGGNDSSVPAEEAVEDFEDKQYGGDDLP